MLVSPSGRALATIPPGLRYVIDVALDPARRRLSGHATILYRSGADSTLHGIFLHTYPNAFRGPHTLFAREGERWGEDYAIRFAAPADRGWMAIDSVTADGKPAAFTMDETVGRIDLPRALAARDSVALRMRFEVQVPRPFNRLGRVGKAYSLGQWYPKVAVYDDRGWHADPYHYFAEFYGDYGSFDVSITLPDDYWVGATGVLRTSRGGDNEIPLADAEASRDSATVTVRAVTADSLRGKWPRDALEIETDLSPRERGMVEEIDVERGRGASLRVPRGAPVHYRYRWSDSGGDEREEADAQGRPGPLRLLIAERDTVVVDTLRAFMGKSAPGDTLLPSLKTLRFHADRVHDFAWVASPDYVRGDTTVAGVAIRSLAFRDDQKRWREQKAFTASALTFFSREVGPYVWPRFTSAESWVGGGAMEYPMLIMNEPGLPSDWAQTLDITIAHELGHNWFYGMLGSDERAHPWLDEGFTQYMEERYSDWKYPNGIFKRRKLIPWASPLRDFLIDESAYLARSWARDEQPPATPAEGYHGWPNYAVGAYARPAMMLRTLRGTLGDSTFGMFLRGYYRANLLRHPRPEDVIHAAEKASGRDLDDWFRPWLEGTGAAGFALGEIRAGRDGRRFRTDVTVRRTGSLPAMVPVRATFRDASVQEMRVSLTGREATVVFQSDAPIRSVALDPRHEVVERNRLDNRSGPSPYRFKPLIDFRSSEAMTFLYGPMIWHGRAEGARLGAWTTGTYLPSRDFPNGISSASGSLVVGTRGGDISWSAELGRRVGMVGARGRLALKAARDAGLFRAGARLGNTATAPGRRHPFLGWRLALEYRDRYDVAPVDPRYWSPGRGFHAKGLLMLDTQGPRRAEHVGLDLRSGFRASRQDAGPELPYQRASVEARQVLDLLPRATAHVSWRFFAGSAFGRPPRELLFDAAEGSRLDSLDRFYLNDRGPLLASGHYLLNGGGGLRGCRGRAVLGKRLWGFGADLEPPRFPVSIFGDIGRIGRRTLGDAGVSCVVGPLRLTLPLWVGSPEHGKDPWRFRWLLSIESLSLPF